MFTPSDREIEKFFENLTPEDFAKTPTETFLTSTEEDERRSGHDDFERFMLEGINRIVDTDGEQDLAITHDGVTARLYQPRPGEDAGPWLGRVKRDAKKHKAQWVFVAMAGEAAWGSPDRMFDPNRPDQVEQARAMGYLTETVNWYAESTEPGHTEIQFGIILFEDDTVRIVQSSTTGGANPAFRRLLHP